jgi:hypothetical protein
MARSSGRYSLKVDSEHLGYFFKFAEFVGSRIRRTGSRATLRVLVERVTFEGHQIGQAHVLAAAACDANLRVDVFSADTDRLTPFLVLRRFWHHFSKTRSSEDFGRFAFYAAISSSKLVRPRPSVLDKRTAEKFMKMSESSLQSKEQVERLVVLGVWVGDLLYDDYLAKTNQPTLNPEAPEFQRHLKDFLERFFWWHRVLSRKKYQLVLSSLVYGQGVVPRLASHFGIESLNVSLHDVYRVRPDHPGFYYHTQLGELLDSVPSETIQRLWPRAIEALSPIGNVVNNYNFYLPLPFGKEISSVRDFGRGELVVLVALHQFTDSPHALGNQVFPDFFEWAKFVAEVAMRTNYKWLIKPHPFSPNDVKVAQDLFSDSSRFSIIDAQTSNAQLARVGLAAVLTVFGSIAVEMAYMGVTPITSALACSYKDFGFARNAQSRHELEKLIFDIPNSRFRPNQEDVLRFVIVDNFLNPRNKFLRSYWDSLRAANASKPGMLLREFMTQHDRDSKLFSASTEDLRAFLRDASVGRFQPKQSFPDI